MMWRVLLLSAAVGVCGESCCTSSRCSKIQECPAGLSCCVERPSWMPYVGGRCYNATTQTCSSCPVFNPNHPEETVCPVEKSLCCGGCVSAQEKQCCHRAQSWDSWVCGKGQECCGFGGGKKSCCDRSTEVCARDVCQKKGQPAGCGGVCTADADCVVGGTKCSRCLPSLTEGVRVCSMELEVPVGDFVAVTVSNRAGDDARSTPSALTVRADVVDGRREAVEVRLSPVTGCTEFFSTWGVEEMTNVERYMLEGDRYHVPHAALFTNLDGKAGGVSLRIFPYLLDPTSSECVLSVRVRRDDTPGVVPVVPVPGRVSQHLGQQGMVVWGTDSRADAMHRPITGRLHVTGSCKGYASLAGVVQRVSAEQHAVYAVQPCHLQNPWMVYLEEGECLVDLDVATVPPLAVPSTKGAVARFHGTTNMTGDFGPGFVVSVVQKPIAGYNEDGCIVVKVTEGSCYVESDIQWADLRPLDRDRPPVTFQATTYNGVWNTRLDFYQRGGGGTGCSGYVTYNHTLNCGKY